MLLVAPALRRVSAGVRRRPMIVEARSQKEPPSVPCCIHGKQLPMAAVPARYTLAIALGRAARRGYLLGGRAEPLG
jgi:hypothetical protein